jgi:hypothetical protein
MLVDPYGCPWEIQSAIVLAIRNPSTFRREKLTAIRTSSEVSASLATIGPWVDLL